MQCRSRSRGGVSRGGSGWPADGVEGVLKGSLLGFLRSLRALFRRLLLLGVVVGVRLCRGEGG